MKPSKTIVSIVFLALLALIVVFLPQVMVKYHDQPSRIPSAFYQGGLKKDTGGSLESTASDYTEMFAPSPALSKTGSLLPLEAYPSSATCAICHGQLHQNWQNSMHSLASRDPWYLKVKELLEFEEDTTAVRQCAGCHAPVALMTGEVGLYSQESNKSMAQGVNCIFCHTIESTHGGGGAYVSNPGRVRMYPAGDYLAETGIENAAHLVMASPGVHKADMHPKWLSGVSGSQLCQSCHSFEQNGVMLQSTYEEWKASSYYQRGVSCQDCHFTGGAGATEEGGHLVEHYPYRKKILKHVLGGGSTVQSPQKELNMKILKETLKLQAQRKGQALQVQVTNVKAGHSVPTGVSDLREMWLEVTVKDSSGKPILTSGTIDASGRLQPGSTVFHTVFGDKNGSPIIRHDIWRATRVLKDTRLKAEETRTVNYPLPTGAKNIQVRLLWRDAPGEFILWVLKQNHREIPVTELAAVTL